MNQAHRFFNHNPSQGNGLKYQDWYSPVAVAYDLTRPRYPQQLLAQLARLPNHAKILEIGCGTGIATVALAELGHSVVALEPSLEMCEVARANCAAHPDVEIHQTRFEDWQLTAGKFDVVLAATAWHWVSADIAYVKASAALKDRGALILLWNVVPQPDDEIFKLLEPVYQTHAPSLADRLELATYSQQLRRFDHQIVDSGYFQGLVAKQMNYTIDYRIEDYLLLLTTLSPYIQLPLPQLEALLIGLREVFDRNLIDRIPLTHLAAIQMAEKI